MNIAVIGTGAMASLFGSYLSRYNNVTLVGVNQNAVDTISKDGITVVENDGLSSTFTPHAVSDSSSMPCQDLVILLVKFGSSADALEQNRNLIGPETYLMTLQNGVGHEHTLLRFADREHVVLGATQHNSSVIKPGKIHHGGSGMTCLGLLDGVNEGVRKIVYVFAEAGFECRAEGNIRKEVWRKVFTNTSASTLTALLQVPLGFIHSDPYANSLMRKLCKEAVTVANHLGFGFDLEEVCSGVDQVCQNAPEAITSMCADIRLGRNTEIDAISGSVVETARKQGISVPFHEMLLSAIHALENKGKENGKCL